MPVKERAIPVREVKERQRKPGITDRMFGFVREVRSELRKVVWPTRQEAINLTAIVIGVSLAVGLFLGLVDTAFQAMFTAILR